jgi:hypothetical protein
MAARQEADPTREQPMRTLVTMAITAILSLGLVAPAGGGAAVASSMARPAGNSGCC